MPHIEICSGVTAIISFGITYDGMTSRERKRKRSFFMLAFLISFARISFSSGFCLKYSLRARLLTSCFLNSRTFYCMTALFDKWLNTLSTLDFDLAISDQITGRHFIISS